MMVGLLFAVALRARSISLHMQSVRRASELLVESLADSSHCAY